VLPARQPLFHACRQGTTARPAAAAAAVRRTSGQTGARAPALLSMPETHPRRPPPAARTATLDATGGPAGPAAASRTAPAMATVAAAAAAGRMIVSPAATGNGAAAAASAAAVAQLPSGRPVVWRTPGGRGATGAGRPGTAEILPTAGGGNRASTSGSASVHSPLTQVRPTSGVCCD